MLLIFLRNEEIIAMDANTIDFKKINSIVCRALHVSEEELYGKSKKSKSATNAFCHILYYLHVEKNVPISVLAKEYKRSKRLIFYHISRHKDFMRIYFTTRTEYNMVYCELETNA
jgi:hypothetical protein